MRGLVNGVGGREERSVENYSEERDGVKKSLEKSKETHISASEDDQRNLTAQREETERVLTTTESTSDAVTTRSKEEVKVVRTTRITAGTKVTEVPPTAAAAAAAAGKHNGNGEGGSRRRVLATGPSQTLAPSENDYNIIDGATVGATVAPLAHSEDTETDL